MTGTELNHYLAEFEQRTSSVETMRSSRAALKAFSAFAGVPFDEANSDHVVAWRDAMLARGRSVSTVAQRLAILRAFYRLLAARGAAATNVASVKKCPPPRLPRSPTTPLLSPKEIDYLLRGPDRSHVRGARDYAIMLLMARLGLRVADVCALQSDALVPASPAWRLRKSAPGDADVLWTLPAEARDAVSNYLELDKRTRTLLRCDGPSAPLFQTLSTTHRTYGGPKGLSARAVESMVARYADLAGLCSGSGAGRKVTPYSLRRAFIRHSLDAGQSYEEVAGVTRHKRVESVARHAPGKRSPASEA